MLDVVSMMSLAVFFGLGLLYVHACEGLKGNKP